MFIGKGANVVVVVVVIGGAKRLKGNPRVVGGTIVGGVEGGVVAVASNILIT